MERGEFVERIAMLERRVKELDSELERALGDAAAFRWLVSLSLPPVGLTEREALLSETERAAKLGTWVWDVRTNAVTWSRELFKILGYDAERDAPTAEAFFAALHPDDVERIREISVFNATSGQSQAEECRVRRPSGDVRDILIDGTSIRDEAGTAIGFVGTVTDITERKAVARALRRSESLLRHAQRIAHMGSWRWDFATDRVEWSEELYAIFAVEPSVTPTTKLFFERVHPDDRARIASEGEQAARGELRSGGECRIVRPDGKLRWVQIDSRRIEDASGVASGLVGTVLDVTNRRQLEDQLRQSQKMEAIGRLAGGVAHDFNNLLMVIRGYTGILQTKQPSDELSQIGEAVDRAATLTHQLLAFSRRALISPRLIEFDAELEDAIRLAAPLLGAEIAVELSLESRPWLVRADAGQVHQIILNLALNARDAMPDGGTLSLSTARACLDAKFVAAHPDAAVGEHVVFSVRDTGTGMSDEVKARALEPFFTTKESGRGTGLGLSTVFGIVRQSGGFLDIDSAVGRGSTVRVYLPRAEESPES